MAKNIIESRMGYVAKATSVPVLGKADKPTTFGFLRPLTLSTVLIPRDYVIEEFSTDMHEKYKEFLVHLLLKANVREDIYTILGARDTIQALIRECLGTANGTVRVHNPLTNYNIVNRTIRESKSITGSFSAESAKALSIILCAVFKDWGFLSGNIPIVSFEAKDKVDVVKSALILEMQRAHIRTLVSEIKVFPISDFIDRFGQTTTESLADVFISSFASTRVALANLRKTDFALNLILPRIKAYVLGKVEEYYKNALERATFADPTFISLATNFTLVSMALEESVAFRPAEAVYFWREYDAMLHAGIAASPYVKEATRPDISVDIN